MIKNIITDFDGTLVDTFKANFFAYQKAFNDIGLELTEENYHKCFGYRFDQFMKAMVIYDEQVAKEIKERKKNYYPHFFSYIKPNLTLLNLIAGFKSMGGKTAIASTASRENLTNVAHYLGIEQHFDLIYTGTDVKQAKPSPEIYLKAIKALDVKPEETLIFEDSEIGIKAAKASGAFYMKVDASQFNSFPNL